ncbi:RNA polymerase sigma factor RpoE [Sphaerisporangium melleum]|uniref:RNA polymerase sigma factor RpoE n=1 Tax=Sphaerisporangium melleum TaxID=321316 RepID=A0A917QZE4_9ACTN|nr:sigma-70 family RNA polymerase sigma factor [Sphaerisporangium melleum]GGK78432.1 RNA polymerase sigma factor RpoE [Sphaerisporangium melleum]GII69813.1 RNA polymerase sigma factor RpoE [Sphaerisporangium melleum]
MADELLVLRCRLGEREALAELVRAWHAPVWTYVRGMLDAARADDVAQEVWLAVLRGLPRLKEPARFAPWLFTIARRAVADHLREEYRRAETAATPELGEQAPGEQADVVDVVEALVERAELLAALSGLPVTEREILVLFYLEDLSIEDCAEVCAIPSGTVKSRLNRARRLLREQLAEKGYSR